MLISKSHEWMTLQPARSANRYELVRTNLPAFQSCVDNWLEGVLIPSFPITPLIRTLRGQRGKN